MSKVFDSTFALPPRLEKRLFGAFKFARVNQGDLCRSPVQLLTRKIEARRAYLVLFSQAHAREKLAALWWGALI
ncbi:MAG: hypothetical protein HDKAJFGB_02756 [Anaerolineae bacterium]|nr:hypothetical protein [Anaerolineae bacterium]MDL1897787.1 hypothetical protein [Anaerolineae bacterium CFX7]RIK29363.1 MAG: hypothetical protein DCC52_07540 [Chloroflexota bacterium]